MFLGDETCLAAPKQIGRGAKDSENTHLAIIVEAHSTCTLSENPSPVDIRL